jgi:multisubunit Na+/H+ antiporter MnhG subunit
VLFMCSARRVTILPHLFVPCMLVLSLLLVVVVVAAAVASHLICNASYFRIFVGP